MHDSTESLDHPPPPGRVGGGRIADATFQSGASSDLATLDSPEPSEIWDNPFDCAISDVLLHGGLELLDRLCAMPLTKAEDSTSTVESGVYWFACPFSVSLIEAISDDDDITGEL
jgi:hypothetical protein